MPRRIASSTSFAVNYRLVDKIIPDDDVDEVVLDDGSDEPLSTAAICPRCHATPEKGWSAYLGECHVCTYYVGDDDED